MLHKEPENTSFEDLAQFYDEFTPEPERLSRLEALSLDGIFRPAGVRTVLDCACGTGIQSLGLANLGYKVACSDLSPGMVRAVRRKARERGLKVTARVADFRDLAPWGDARFDAVICAGNSLSVCRTLSEMGRSVRAMRRHLRGPHSIVVLGLRNYRLLERRKATLNLRCVDPPSRYWFDVRTFGARRVQVVYVSVHGTPTGLTSRAWTKSYAYLDPRGGAALLRAVGFREVRMYDVRGLGPYRGGEWGFVAGRVVSDGAG
jgi:SAM-dependent methyltransferase